MLRLLPTLAILAVALLSGCASSVRTAQHERADPTALLALDIENFRGSVEVRVDPMCGEPQVYAQAFGAAFLEDDEADAEVQKAISLETELVEDKGRSTLVVRTTSTRKTNDHEVALVIHTPRCDGVRVRNRGGLVELVGVSGTLDIENSEGHVEVRTNKALTQDITVLVVDGTVYFQIPEGSTGEFDLETLQGVARFKNRVGDATNTYSTETQVQTVLENASNRVVMRTNLGDLRVNVMDDPESYTRVLRFRRVDIEEGLYLQGSRRYTRNLPDDDKRPPSSRP